MSSLVLGGEPLIIRTKCSTGRATRGGFGLDSLATRSGESSTRLFVSISAAVTSPSAAVTAAATTVATAATVATTTAAVAASAAAFGARPSLIDRQATALEILPVQARDRRVGVSVIFHLDKAKASASTRLTVTQHLGADDRSKLLENFLEVTRGDAVGQIPDVKPLSHRTRAWNRLSTAAEQMQKTVGTG